MENLPQVQPGSSLEPTRSEKKRELIVCGDEIYLPDSGRFRPDDAEFATIVKEVLPDYSASLSEEALHRPPAYSAWAVILILLFFTSLITVLFLLRPQVSLKNTVMEIPLPKVTNYIGEFSRQYKKAAGYKKDERYTNARKCLSPVIDDLLKRPEVKSEEQQLFYFYFSLFERLKWDEDAKEQLKRLIELDKDQYRWKLFNIRRIQSALGGDNLDQLPKDRKGIDEALMQIKELRRWQVIDKNLPDQLDFYECYFKFKLWRLKNHPKADDEYGLRERERVWEIASKHPQDKKFLEIKRELIRKLLPEIHGWYYRVEGEDYVLKSHLKRKLNEIETILGKKGKK